MKTWTVQQVIDKILMDMCGGAKINPTCDIISIGRPRRGGDRSGVHLYGDL